MADRSELLAACEGGRLDVVRRIARREPSLLKSRLGEYGGTPLHVACGEGYLEIAQYIVQQDASTTTIKNDEGATPLHLACRCGHLEIAQYIVQQDPSMTTVKDRNGDTPLHDACREGYLEIAQYIVQQDASTTIIKNDAGFTPLHLACLNIGWYPGCRYVADYLIRHMDPEWTDDDGSSLLHFACRYGCTAVIPYLLKEAQIDPDCTTEDGETALSLAKTPDMIRELLRHGVTADYRLWSQHLSSKDPNNPTQPAVKTFIVGDPGAGKSSLTKALGTESKGLSYIANRLSKVSGVDKSTAGIIPHDIQRRNFGRLMLYDFAGQKEFYAGHDAILRSAVSGSPAAVFLIVADLRQMDEQFAERIQYWLTFLENQGVSADPKPHLVIVGSHVDQLKKVEIEKKRIIVDSLQSLPAFSSFHYTGLVTMDCRYSVSESMSLLHHHLAKSCEDLRETVKMSVRGHHFLVYLSDKFQGIPAVQLSSVATTVCNESALKQLPSFFPKEISGISQICDELNVKGDLLFLQNAQNLESSWIILDREALLSHVIGTIFAPKDFKQHLDLASSTGVVPISKINTHFSDFNSDMITHFLCHLEFCHRIVDSEILQLLNPEASESAVSDPTEKFFFFPGLVSIEAPIGVWESSPKFVFSCGWILRCKILEHFFTPRFLQALLLRLAFSFALAPQTDEVSSELLPLQRKCKVWKAGICWRNRSGVEALVEVGEGSKRVVVLLRCLNGRVVECAHLRSMIISKVLQTKSEFCPKVLISEVFLRPSDCKVYPPKSSSELVLVAAAEVATTIADEKPYALDGAGEVIELCELLGFEPYAYLDQHILQQLFNDPNPAHSDRISCAVYGIADRNFKKMLQLSKSTQKFLTKVSPGSTKRERSEGSRQFLRERLDQFSVFAGRNPLDFENSQVSTTFTPLQPTLTDERVHVEGATQGDTHDVSHLSLQQPVTQERVQRAQVGGATLLTIDDISYHCKPTMTELLNFTFAGKKVSIATEIGTKYVRFGTILLQDTTGSRVKNMAHKYLNDPERINTEILREWLTGNGKIPVTWATLVEVLHDIGLSNLAETVQCQPSNMK